MPRREMAETVLIYGDSNVAGWRPDAPKLFKKGETWASMLAAKLDATVVVDGLPGRALVHNLDTPEADYQRFKKVCNQAGNISLLILMIGVNDFALNNGAMTVISHINEYIRLSNAKHTIYVPHPGICYERLPKMFEYFTKEHCEPIFREFSGNLGRINATILQLERQ